MSFYVGAQRVCPTVRIVEGGAFEGIPREIINGKFSMPTINTFSLPSGVIDIGDYAMYYAFRNCTGLTSIDLSSLTTISGSSAMYYAFISCTGLTTMDLSSLTTISGSRAMYSAFSGCTNLSNISFPSLEIIGINDSTFNCSQFSYAFYNCNSLTTLTFPELTAIYCTGGTSTDYGTFANNNKIQKMYFPKLTTITYGEGASTTNQNACKNIFYGCSSLTELHFAAANQAAIEASPGYSTAWGRGAGNVTIYFDL